MSMEIKVPALPESVVDATIATWHKRPGEKVTRDENLVDIETDKVVLEVVAPADGTIASIVKKEGDTVVADEVIAMFQSGSGTPTAISTKPVASQLQVKHDKPEIRQAANQQQTEPKNPASADVSSRNLSAGAANSKQVLASPGIRRALARRNIDPASITGTGDGGRITKEDVISYVQEHRVIHPQTTVKDATSKSDPMQQAAKQHPQQAQQTKQAQAQQQVNQGATAKSSVASNPAPTVTAATVTGTRQSMAATAAATGQRTEKRVPMTRLRARIAERLLQAQSSAAILTTFNEVNMQPIVDLRSKYKDKFEQAHGVRLGFMSFFVVAAIEALKQFPAVNASIDGNDIVYHGYYDIGIAVSSPRGLVVPVLRNAETLNFARIEKSIIDFGDKAQTGKLTLAEMTGGTFTISNGGVFGSPMSTPILNPPQSGILGMHKIEQRPIVENGEIVIRPMMYLALSYDHRIIDGSESVRFLLTIKNMLEDPTRLLLHV